MKIRNSKKGQVAVEFILMFVLVISILIYAFYFAVSFATLHYRSYEVFMVGRAVLSASNSYAIKDTRAKDVQALYDKSFDSQFNSSNISRDLSCNLDPKAGFRGTMDYGYPVAYNVGSNAGIVCSVYVDYVLPSVITRSNGNHLQVAIESMTGSEMSDEHCICAMTPGMTWKECIQAGGFYQKQFIDNGC